MFSGTYISSYMNCLLIVFARASGFSIGFFFFFGGARVFNIVSMLTHYLLYIAIPSPPPTCALSLNFIQNEEIFRYQVIQAREGIVLVQPGSFFCLSTVLLGVTFPSVRRSGIDLCHQKAEMAF